jgi:hypothetical protein
VFQNSAKGKEVTGGWKQLHSKGLHNFYSSPNIIRVIILRRMRWAIHVARMGEMRNAYKISVGNSEGKRLLRRHRRRCEGNIKTDLGESR